jgi:hypothetical protein
MLLVLLHQEEGMEGEMKQLVVASSLKNLRWKDSWSEDSGLSATTTCADREQSRVEVWFVAYLLYGTRLVVLQAKKDYDTIPVPMSTTIHLFETTGRHLTGKGL